VTAPGEGGPAARPARPLLRVVRGEPTAEELAALVSVVAALASRAAAARDAGGPASRSAPPLWRDRSALVRAPLRAGPGAWRASGLPR